MKYPLKEHFIEDFEKGYSRYYYSLLVNAQDSSAHYNVNLGS